MAGHQLLPKQFVFTLGVGFTFGFSLAYMILAGSGLGGRREIFHGPPPYPAAAGDPHSHQDQVRLPGLSSDMTEQMFGSQVLRGLQTREG